MVYVGLDDLLQKKSPRIAKIKDLNNFLNNIAGIDFTTEKGREKAMWHTCNIIMIQHDSNTRLPDMLMADLLDPFWLELMMDVRGAIMTASYDPKSAIAAFKIGMIRLNTILRSEERFLGQQEMEENLGIKWKE